MKKTTKIMLGISTTAMSLGLAGCGKELPPKPKDQACRDWDWNDELGVWECDETTSRHYGGYYYVVFTAHAENTEDRETVRYLATAVDAPFIPLEQLQIERGVGLFDAYGQKIDVLYRQTFPIESLIDDVDQQGNPIGQWLLELVAQQKVALINPPSAFLLQNKAVQAIIWALYEQRHPFFTDVC
ncbi:glutathionylspermidine synthase [Kurthia huakuii]|nr:glutathionylspermidine synthase family protein [Kurthia huakuii]MBM7700586.1 glutathionylspermidine synthase [Kurthia huakuii]